MTQDEIIDAWNKQADYMNKWNYLGEDEKLEWAIKLEREACAKLLDEMAAKDKVSNFYAVAARAIRDRKQA